MALFVCVPSYVHLSYALGLVSLPLALFVPPPQALVRRGAQVGAVLLVLSAGLVLAAGVLLVVLEDSYPGVALAGLSVTVFLLMLWAAGAPRRRPPDEGEDGGGGGGRGPVRPPEAPDAPDGLGVDWREFDRARSEWSDRERV